MSIVSYPRSWLCLGSIFTLATSSADLHTPTRCTPEGSLNTLAFANLIAQDRGRSRRMGNSILTSQARASVPGGYDFRCQGCQGRLEATARRCGRDTADGNDHLAEQSCSEARVSTTPCLSVFRSRVWATIFRWRELSSDQSTAFGPQAHAVCGAVASHSTPAGGLDGLRRGKATRFSQFGSHSASSGDNQGLRIHGFNPKAEADADPRNPHCAGGWCMLIDAE